jgi:hypothetical protein
MLIGSDVLSKCWFTRNGPDPTFCLAY